MKDYTAWYAMLNTGKHDRFSLMEGEEEFTKEKGLEQLLDYFRKQEFPEMNITYLADPDAGELIAACETLPFMAEKRLVIVKNCSMLLNGKSKNFDEDKSVEQLKDYLPAMPEQTVLVFFIRGKAESRKKLYTVLKKENAIYSFDRLDDPQLTRWLMQRFRNYGLSADEECCKALTFRSGKDLIQLAGETDKLRDYLGENGIVTNEVIETVCSETTEYKVFDLADALLSGQGKKSFGILEQLLRQNTDRVLLVSLLGKQCRQLMYAAEYTDRYKAASALGLPTFIAEKLLKQAAGYSREQLREMPALCLDTEFHIKNGDLPENGALENVMIRILYMRGKKNG